MGTVARTPRQIAEKERNFVGKNHNQYRLRKLRYRRFVRLANPHRIIVFCMECSREVMWNVWWERVIKIKIKNLRENLALLNVSVFFVFGSFFRRAICRYELWIDRFLCSRSVQGRKIKKHVAVTHCVGKWHSSLIGVISNFNRGDFKF